MVFQIKFVLPDGKPWFLLQYRVEVSGGCGVFDFRKDILVFIVLEAVQHFPVRSSPMIPEPVKDKSFPRAGVHLEPLEAVDHPFGPQAPDIPGRRKIGQDARTVHSLPPKKKVGENIGIIPTDFLGDERIDSTPLEELRHVPVIAEGVGIPADFDVHAEFLLEVPFSVQDLTDKGFAVDEVAVRLGPHAADDFPTALLDLFFDALEDVWIVLFHPLIGLSLALDIDDAWILLYVVHDRGEGFFGDFDTFPPAPQPGQVDVRIPSDMKGIVIHESDDRLGFFVKFEKRHLDLGQVSLLESLEIKLRHGFFKILLEVLELS